MLTKTLAMLLSVMVLIGLVTACVEREAPRSDVTLEGAGASFPFPVYSAWGYEYEGLSGMKLNYQSVGSGAGISSIQAKTVDFGASDSPLPINDLEDSGLIQFPMVIGGIVLVVNLPGISAGQLKLSEDALAGIYLGTITTWNDPAITSVNADIDLPDKPIVVVHRADGSGTTWIFTNYLSAISIDWAGLAGTGKSIEWPVGMGGRGNEGVANYVSQVDGAIGYVEFAYAKQNNLAYCMLENYEGGYVMPNAGTFGAAAAHADWEHAPGFHMVLVNQPGAETWPITGASFIILYKQQDDCETARGMLEFFHWCFTDGQSKALELDYVPMPENVVELVEKNWADEVVCGGTAVWE